jgi:hypothetical protein
VPARVSSLNAPTVRGRVNTRCWVCRGTTQLPSLSLSLSLNGGCFTHLYAWPHPSRGEVCGWRACPHTQPGTPLVGHHQLSRLLQAARVQLTPWSVLPAPTFTLVSGAARRQCRLHVELAPAPNRRLAGSLHGAIGGCYEVLIYAVLAHVEQHVAGGGTHAALRGQRHAATAPPQQQ